MQSPSTNSDSPAVSPFVDVNVYLSRWPFRQLPLDDPSKLADALAQRGITEAWIGNFDALLHRDMAAVNLATVESCKRYGSNAWQPIGCVNPMLPDWEEDLRRCHEVFGMFAIRLHPNFHNYKLVDDVGVNLLRAASERGMLVQIATSMEDIRTQHPLCKVERVDHRPLVQLLQDIPKLRVMLLNLFHSGPVAVAAAVFKPGRVWFDIATLEGVEGVSKLIAATDAGAVVHGSYAPYFYTDGSYLKLIESNLEDSLRRRLSATNAHTAKQTTN